MDGCPVHSDVKIDQLNHGEDVGFPDADAPTEEIYSNLSFSKNLPWRFNLTIY